MAKKNYQHTDADWCPQLTNEGSHIEMTFTGANSKGTRAKTTIKLQKGAIPQMLRAIVAIFHADAAVAIRALELVKESAK